MNENQTPLGPTDAQIIRMRATVHATIAAEQSHTRRRRGWTIGGTLGLLVVLAGGTSVAMAAGVLQAPSWFTAAPAPEPTATHEPVTVTTVPTPSVTPTPTPTPTPTAAWQPGVAPKSRIPLDCGEVLTASALAAALGDGAQPSMPDAELGSGYIDVLPTVVASDARQTLGLEYCGWLNPNTNASLGVLIAPADAFDPTLLGSTAGMVELGADAEIGGDAIVWRDEGGDAVVSASVNGMVLRVTATEGDPSVDPIADAKSAAGAAFQQLRAAPAPSPAFTADGGIGASCADFADAITAKPGTGVLTPTSTGSDFQYDAYQFGYMGGLDCSYSHRSSDGSNPMDVMVLYLPGGAWDWARTRTLSTGALKLSPVDGLGDDALAGCVAAGAAPYDQDECEVEVRLGDAWLHVQMETADRPTALAIAKTIVEEITELAD